MNYQVIIASNDLIRCIISCNMDDLTNIFDFTTIQSEADFRELCATYSDADAESRLKNIAFVGARDAEIGVQHKPDSKRLTAALVYMLQSGFAFDEDFEIDIINFQDKRDFLNEQKPYDAVFISLIRNQRGDENPNHKPPNYSVFSSKLSNTILGNWHNTASMVSPHHSPDAWLKRARQAGAKVIVTFGTQNDEIGTDMFCCPDLSGDTRPYIMQTGARVSNAFPNDTERTDLSEAQFVNVDPYTPLIDSPHISSAVTVDVLEALEAEGIEDVPLNGLGFCIDQNFLRNNLRGFNSNTFLGQQAVKVCEDKPESFLGTSVENE